MADMTDQELEAAVDASFDTAVDQVFDDQLALRIGAATDPADFWVTKARLRSTAATAFATAPIGTLARVSAGAAPFASGFSSTLSDPVVEAADDEKREAAAKGVQELICQTIRDKLEAKLDDLKTWIESVGIASALKKLAGLAKQMVMAAVKKIAGVVGSLAGAYLLLGVAVAAVGAAIYFLVKKGFNQYCPAPNG